MSSEMENKFPLGFPQTNYTLDQLEDFHKGDPKVYHDGGAGATQHSIEYFKKLKGKLGRIVEIRVSTDRDFTMEIFSDAGWVLLSGCNCGYGGTGPHGTIEILRLLGFQNGGSDYEREVFTERNVKIDCRDYHVYW
jgi:hypothetical protein